MPAFLLLDLVNHHFLTTFGTLSSFHSITHWTHADYPSLTCLGSLSHMRYNSTTYYGIKPCFTCICYRRCLSHPTKDCRSNCSSADSCADRLCVRQTAMHEIISFNIHEQYNYPILYVVPWDLMYDVVFSKLLNPSSPDATCNKMLPPLPPFYVASFLDKAFWNSQLGNSSHGLCSKDLPNLFLSWCYNQSWWDLERVCPICKQSWNPNQVMQLRCPCTLGFSCQEGCRTQCSR